MKSSCSNQASLPKMPFLFGHTKPILALICLLFSACSTPPKKDTVEVILPPSPEAPSKPTKIPDRKFTSEALYALLVAEIAIDRRRYDIALGNYVQQATSTRDPSVASRATQIARILKSHQSALEMAQLWEDLEPSNENARIIVTAELIQANRLTEASNQAAKLLRAGTDSAFDTIALKATENDIAVVRKLIDIYGPLAIEFPNSSALQLGYSVLLQRNDQLDQALTAAQRAMNLEPENIRFAIQETRVLQQMGQQDLALKKLSTLVEANPDNISLRARYARILSGQDLNESRKQFEILHNQAPNDPEILYSLALVEKESGYLEKALQRFEQLLKSGFYTSAANFHLGILKQKRGEFEEALTHFDQVQPGQNYLNAIIKASGLLVSSNREYDALQWVRRKRASSPALFSEGLYVLEADILSSAGQISAAELALSDGLKEFPKSTKLLYARAMLFTRIDSIDAAEKDLRAILDITPSNAAALNALGYTLADRTDRIEEAYSFIKRAMALTPDDPAVLDSMGWVEYRRGNHIVALELLRKAMKAMPDHEIAAHLGEVLWATGNKKEAQSTWKQGLRLNPKSNVIHKTIHRLNATLD